MGETPIRGHARTCRCAPFPKGPSLRRCAEADWANNRFSCVAIDWKRLLCQKSNSRFNFALSFANVALQRVGTGRTQL